MLQTKVKSLHLHSLKIDLNWVLTADATTTSGFTFNGQLQGTWSNALGLKWLSFTDLDIQFQFVPDTSNPIEKFTFNGETAISFSANSAPTTVQFYTLLSNGKCENGCYI